MKKYLLMLAAVIGLSGCGFRVRRYANRKGNVHQGNQFKLYNKTLRYVYI